MAPTLPSQHARQSVILDTNVALDWLVFDDPRIQTLRQQIEAGSLRWLTTAAMREELSQVLKHASLFRYQPDCERSLAIFDRWVVQCPDTVPQAAPPLRCRDADDQVFLDLALREKVAWLISRDRDLLALAGKARGLGLVICTPEAWGLNPAVQPLSPATPAPAGR